MRLSIKRCNNTQVPARAQTSNPPRDPLRCRRRGGGGHIATNHRYRRRRKRGHAPQKSALPRTSGADLFTQEHSSQGKANATPRQDLINSRALPFFILIMRSDPPRFTNYIKYALHNLRIPSTFPASLIVVYTSMPPNRAHSHANVPLLSPAKKSFAHQHLSV